MATASNTDLVEFSSSVRLSCSASGSSLSFLWLNSSSEVTASDRVQLTDGGATLTILEVTRYDQGPFRCRVSNPLSDGTSDPINLSISYGPDNVILTVSPSQEYHAEGSNIDLMCSADSRPAAQFMWLLNGVLLSHTGPQFKLMNIQMSQSGKYSCQALNIKTLRYESPPPATISVLNGPENVHITGPSQIHLKESLTLTCSAESRPSATYTWMLNGTKIHNSAAFTKENVQYSDSGIYTCEAMNDMTGRKLSADHGLSVTGAPLWRSQV